MDNNDPRWAEVGSDSAKWPFGVQVWYAGDWHTLSYRYPCAEDARRAIALERAEGNKADLRVVEVAMVQ